MPDQKLHARHPLAQRQKPGPRIPDDPTMGPEAILGEAAAVLGALDAGVLDSKPPPLATLGPFKHRLTAEQEKALAYRVQTWGDIDARNMLVAKNIRLVRWKLKGRIKSPHYEDAVQEGVLGLVRAAETFDPRREIRFSTYAVHWINAKATRFFLKMQQQEEPATTDGGDTYFTAPSGRKIRRRTPMERLDAPFTSDGDIGSLSDVVADQSVDMERALIRAQQCQLVHDAAFAVIATMNPLRQERARVVLQMRVLADDPVTFAEIAPRVGLSREGVRQLETLLLRRVKEALYVGGHLSASAKYAELR